MKNKHIKKIIFNFFENPSNPDEIQQLAQWVKDNPSSFKESAELHYLITRSLGQENAEQYKKELLSKFDLLVRSKRKRRQAWLRYAAIFIGLIGISTLLLLRNNTPKTIGQQEVTIVLDNGTTKELSNKDASGIVTRSNNIIAEQDGSKIVYKKVSIDNDDLGEPLVYNTLNVPYGKKFEIVLSDGTQVYLNSGSSLTYPTAFYASGPRDVELTGEAYFTVESDSLRPFRVKTRELDTKVLGTQFNLSSYPDDETVQVVLVEGSLSVKRSNGSEASHLLLKPNQMASYSNGHKELQLTDVDVSRYTAWKEGILYFKNEDFIHITKKLERHYNVTIEIRGDLLKSERYTGRFKTETIEEVLQGFQRIKDFDYKITNDKIILTQKNN
ncbi:FecR family protein [Flagellimonas taeanensis]|uniref:FecR family protein n=1 Tax=Flagellimonas taeanensis TaxID=1005926 RepID=A0A1M7BGM2_9FLAO|nr:FecR domain-containing protein [Allomuricauda taeanensis]SFC40440.1 FecR family protein [Allomuricauda taeanensis]SHL53759.1 FecR family protein [Allomuricauda taeanensis]